MMNLIDKIARRIVGLAPTKITTITTNVKFKIDRFQPLMIIYYGTVKPFEVQQENLPHLLFFSAENSVDAMNGIMAQKVLSDNEDYTELKNNAINKVERLIATSSNKTDIESHYSQGILIQVALKNAHNSTFTLKQNDCVESKDIILDGEFKISGKTRDGNDVQFRGSTESPEFDSKITVHFSNKNDVGKVWFKDMFDADMATNETELINYRRRYYGKKIMAANNNVLDDFYDFYSDGKWLIENIRKIQDILNEMLKNANNYITQIVQLQEYIGYIGQTKIDKFSTSSAHKEYKSFLSKIKKAYNLWEKDDTPELLESYYDEVKNLKKFNDSYNKSCISIFRTAYLEDEDNIRNLLDTIHESGDIILNK